MKSSRLRQNSLIVASLTLFLSALPGVSGQAQDVRRAENANEARLNGLQPPDQVMDVIGVKPGMAVAEIGAGRGRYVVHLAVRVGEAGKVYAEDINAPSLKHLESRCRNGGLDNVVTVLGDVTDPKLPEGELDLIFVISSYHHFDDPIALMRNARPALKPDGRLAIAEWIPRGEDTAETTTPEEMEAQMKAAGYRLERIDKLLEANRMYIYLFRLDVRHGNSGI
jgi:ubiquinone/menaquinone biosynthesis C-methylase UbiE